MRENFLFIFLLVIIVSLSECTPASYTEADSAELMKSLPTEDVRAVKVLDSLLSEVDKGSREELGLLGIRQKVYSRMASADSVLQDAFRIQQLARRLDDSLAYARALLLVSGDIDESKFKHLEESYLHSIGIFSRREHFRDQATIMAIFASFLNNSGRYEESQKTAMAAIALPGVKGMDTLRARIFLTIANNYEGTNALDKALKYFRMAKSIAVSTRDSALLSSILLDMGIVHYDAKSDSSQFYYKEALAALPSRGEKLLKLKILYNMAVDDFEARRNAKALASFRHLLETSRSEGFLMGEGVAYKALGFYHEANGRPDSAIYYLKRSIEIADSIKQPFLKIQALLELEKAYKTAGDKEQAFRQHLVTDKIKDSMFTVDKEAIIHGLEMQYDTEINVLENINLKKGLTIRHTLLALFGLISVALLIFLRSERQRNRLLSERNQSYDVLMAKYRTERAVASELEKTKSAELSTAENLPLALTATQANLDTDTCYIELQHLFKYKEIYKEPKLLIEDVAALLNVQSKEITAILKEREETNFRQYVNKFRILEARRLMEDPDNLNLKLEAIGEMSGFVSRPHFQKVFESIVGVTPGYYRRSFFQDNTHTGEIDAN